VSKVRTKELVCPKCKGSEIEEYGTMYYWRAVTLDDNGKTLWYDDETITEPTEGSPDGYRCAECEYEAENVRPFVREVT